MRTRKTSAIVLLALCTLVDAAAGAQRLPSAFSGVVNSKELRKKGEVGGDSREPRAESRRAYYSRLVCQRPKAASM